MAPTIAKEIEDTLSCKANDDVTAKHLESELAYQKAKAAEAEKTIIKLQDQLTQRDMMQANTRHESKLLDAMVDGAQLSLTGFLQAYAHVVLVVAEDSDESKAWRILNKGFEAFTSVHDELVKELERYAGAAMHKSDSDGSDD